MRGNKSVDKEKFSSCFDNGFEWIGARPRVEPGGELSIWKMRHHHWNIWQCKFYFLLSSHTFHFSFSLRPTSISTDIKVAFCPTKWFCSLSQELDRTCCYKSGTLLIPMESFSHIAVAHKTWLLCVFVFVLCIGAWLDLELVM